MTSQLKILGEFETVRLEREDGVAIARRRERQRRKWLPLLPPHPVAEEG